MVKATQKKPKNTSKQSSKWSDKRILGLLLFAMLAYLFIAIFYFRTAQHLDAKKFANAERTQKQITNEIVNNLGDTVTSVQTKNVCFNTEQGPYDNGRLWCQTASVVKLSKDVDYEQVKDVFIKNAPNGSTVNQTEGTLSTGSFNLPNGIYCSIDQRNSDRTIYGSARQLPFKDTEINVVSVSCADRAKAKHYPYSP